MFENEFGPLLGTVVQFLDEIRVRHSSPQIQVDPDGAVRFRIICGMRLTHGYYKISILGDEKRKVVGFYGISPVVVPRSRMVSMAEFVARINYGLGVGNFELGLDDGEIRYKTSLPADGTPLNYALLRSLLTGCVSTLDEFAPALESVITGEATPFEADILLRRHEEEE